MKYVTLEHRQSLPYGVIGCTYINFDTNDTTFENEAHELRRQRNSKQEEAKNQIIDESGHVFGTILQIKNELNNLRHDTPILKRFSKVYRNELVKDVIQVKLERNAARQEQVAKASEKAMLEALLVQKQTEALKNLSEEEIRKRLAEL